MGLSVNERFSFNLGFDSHYVTTTVTEINGRDFKSEALQVGSFTLGFSYRINPTYSTNLTLYVGATEDAPDMRLVSRWPIWFNALL